MNAAVDGNRDNADPMRQATRSDRHEWRYYPEGPMLRCGNPRRADALCLRRVWYLAGFSFVEGATGAGSKE
jgi:hypothetical protein